MTVLMILLIFLLTLVFYHPEKERPGKNYLEYLQRLRKKRRR